MIEDRQIENPFECKNSYQNTLIYSRNHLFHSEFAPDMTFETVHPDNPDTNFIFSFLAPDCIFSNTFSYEEAYQEVYSHGLHQHDYFEMLYVIHGEMYQRIESERHLYPAGSLCLLNCSIRHQEEFSTDFRAVFLRIPVSFIREILYDIKSFFFKTEQKLQGNLQEKFFYNNLEHSYILRKEYLDFIPKDQPQIKEYMYSLFEHLTQQFLHPSIGSSYLIKHYIILIFQELSLPSHYRTVPLNIGSDAETELFNSISSLIKIKKGRISRVELEEKLSYNGNYLNRIVKKYTGLSLHQYGMTICMNEAASLLINSNLKIADICERLGFSNQTEFYKLFQKRYGMTPKKYRNTNKSYDNKLT